MAITCQKLLKLVDPRRSYNVLHQCRFFETVHKCDKISRIRIIPKFNQLFSDPQSTSISSFYEDPPTTF